MTVNEFLVWLGAGGGVSAVGKVIYDVIKARGEAKRGKADAAQVLVTTATESAAEYAADLAELRQELREVRNEQRAQEKRITAHLRWDRQVVEALRELGGSITDPPPLYAEES